MDKQTLLEGDNFPIHKAKWESDYNGEDVGYNNIPVIGTYTLNDITYYINTEDNTVVEVLGELNG